MRALLVFKKKEEEKRKQKVRLNSGSEECPGYEFGEERKMILGSASLKQHLVNR